MGDRPVHGHGLGGFRCAIRSDRVGLPNGVHARHSLPSHAVRFPNRGLLPAGLPRQGIGDHGAGVEPEPGAASSRRGAGRRRERLVRHGPPLAVGAPDHVGEHRVGVELRIEIAGGVVAISRIVRIMTLFQ